MHTYPSGTAFCLRGGWLKDPVENASRGVLSHASCRREDANREQGLKGEPRGRLPGRQQGGSAETYRGPGPRVPEQSLAAKPKINKVL